MAKIVVVDDSRLARRGILKLLKNEGHEIIEAENGRLGVDAVFECSPDCVILDLLMPELDGFGALQELKDKKNMVPVIIMTADIQDTVKQKVMEMGAIAFLNKPPRMGDLIEAVNMAIGK